MAALPEADQLAYAQGTSLANAFLARVHAGDAQPSDLHRLAGSLKGWQLSGFMNAIQAVLLALMTQRKH